jgi:hypothetical protein
VSGIFDIVPLRSIAVYCPGLLNVSYHDLITLHAAGASQQIDAVDNAGMLTAAAAAAADCARADCVQNTDQRATCTWNEPVGPGDDKLVQFRVTANKTGTYQNRATVLTTMPGVANQTATAPVTIVPPVRRSSVSLHGLSMCC